MVKKFSKIGVCMVFVLSMILPQAAVSKAKTANPYTGKKYIYCSNYKDGIELYGKYGLTFPEMTYTGSQDREHKNIPAQFGDRFETVHNRGIQYGSRRAVRGCLFF